MDSVAVGQGNCWSRSTRAWQAPAVRVSEITVHEITRDQTSASALLDGIVDVERAFWADLAPSDPPIGADELRLQLFQTKARKPHRVWIATTGGSATPVGYVRLALPRDGNASHVEVWASVAHEARRGGVGSALVRASLSEVRADREVAVTWARPGPGSAFCDRLGLTPRQEERGSRLDTSTVDDLQQQAWIDDAPARAKGYRMVTWRGPYPEEWLDEICEAADSMSDAPRDGVEHDHVKVTREMLRDGDRSVAGRFEQFGSLALGPDGQPAGFTELGVNLHRPQLGEQGDTCVVAGHRGLRLGRWLKAANLASARASWPELRWVQTFNAETNPWMLAINVEQGYRPFTKWVCYQGSVDRALAALDGR
jgi:GNAT superfamily N-acetyltransferase